MGRCGCGSSTCQCSLSSTACLAITGTGTSADPILIAPVISTDAINRLECRATGLYASMWGKSATVATSQTTASLTFADLATAGPAVTVTTGTAALVHVGCMVSNNTANDGGIMGYVISGATTTAASDLTSAGLQNMSSGTGGLRVGRTFSETLTAGSNVFTAKYHAVAGGTATFVDRVIIVIPYNVLP